jgi:AAA domain
VSVGYPGDYASWPRDRQNRAYAEGAYADRKPSTPATLKTAAEFCAEYAPLSYAIEPIVRSRSLYTLTAKTGAGKTALMVAAGLAVPTGRSDILGVDVEQGRVAYCAFENPDDVRMRLMIAAYLLNVNLADLADRLVVLDVRMKPEDVIVKLAAASEGGFFSLILADTLAAWFDGKDINDNVQAGDFIRRVRPLTALPGNPSVLVAAHPTKGAGEDQLVPYGGGAILNEVDGNLSLWRKPDTGNVHLHWQGKLRGLEFKQRPFRFEIASSPDILDAKGRQVQLPVIRPIAEADDEARQQIERNLDAALLRVMKDNPSGSQADWATAIGLRNKSGVNRKLQQLKGEKLVETALGRWILTAKAEKALKS